MVLIPEKYQRDILIYAFRYTLGRATFAPHTIVEILRLRWDMISEADQRLYQREIIDAIRHDMAGMDCDKKAWLSILDLKLKKD